MPPHTIRCPRRRETAGDPSSDLIERGCDVAPDRMPFRAVPAFALADSEWVERTTELRTTAGLFVSWKGPNLAREATRNGAGCRRRRWGTDVWSCFGNFHKRESSVAEESRARKYPELGLLGSPLSNPRSPLSVLSSSRLPVSPGPHIPCFSRALSTNPLKKHVRRPADHLPLPGQPKSSNLVHLSTQRHRYGLIQQQPL